MEITRAVSEFGTDAVLRYREISHEPDNEIPEVFLGGFMAPRLHDRFDCPAHVERSYLLLANREGVRVTNDLIKKLGGLRADLALNQAGFPPAVIELKIFDEGGSPSDVVGDVFKVRRLAEVCSIRGYIGVLICQTNYLLERQVERLEAAVERKIYSCGEKRSFDDRWSWCFGCFPVLGAS